MRHAGTVLVTAGLAFAGVTGCASGETSSVGTTTTVASALWNPCTEIPDDVLRAAGVDPASEEKGVAGVSQSGWEICGWMAPEYGLTVYSTGKSLSEFESKPGNIGFTDVNIAGRGGRQFEVAGDTRNLICDVVFATRTGVVQLEVTNRASLDGLEDPCVYLNRAGDVLVPVFPQ